MNVSTSKQNNKNQSWRIREIKPSMSLSKTEQRLIQDGYFQVTVPKITRSKIKYFRLVYIYIFSDELTKQIERERLTEVYQQEMVLETWVTRKGNTVCVCAVRHLLIRLPTMIFLTQLSSSRLCLQF